MPRAEKPPRVPVIPDGLSDAMIDRLEAAGLRWTSHPTRPVAETTSWYRGWKHTRKQGEPSPFTLPVIATIDAWHAGSARIAPVVLDAGIAWDTETQIARGAPTIAGDDEVLAKAVAQHPDALCLCGATRKEHTDEGVLVYEPEHCEAFEHDDQQDRYANIEGTLVLYCGATGKKAADKDKREQTGKILAGLGWEAPATVEKAEAVEVADRRTESAGKS